MQDLVDAFGDGKCRVERDGVVQIRREARLQVLHRPLDLVGDRECVGARYLEDRDDRRRFSVVPPDRVVQLRAELETRDVLQQDLGSIRIRSDDDVAELRFVQ